MVLDASAMVELLLRTDTGARVADRLAADGGPYLAPHLIDPEVMQALRELVRKREITVQRAEAAQAAFVAFPLHRVPHDVLLSRMWALRDNLTAYDATYVVIAELRDCSLVTCDGRLSRAPGHRATIELF
jgi:predicted nucleic acid-binding protein